jgi:hypothetical protein
MSEDKYFQRLDSLLEAAFCPVAAEAPAGFQARIMARIGEKADQNTVFDILRIAAKPLLVSGWVAAGLLAYVAIQGLNHGQDLAMAAVMNGDALSRWVLL